MAEAEPHAPEPGPRERDLPTAPLEDQAGEHGSVSGALDALATQAARRELGEHRVNACLHLREVSADDGGAVDSGASAAAAV